MTATTFIWTPAHRAPTAPYEEVRGLPAAERLCQYGRMFVHLSGVHLTYDALIPETSGYDYYSMRHMTRDKELLFVAERTPKFKGSILLPDLYFGVRKRGLGEVAIGLREDRLPHIELDLPIDRLVVDAFDEHFEALEERQSAVSA